MELSEIQEKVLKIVEMEADADYVVLVDAERTSMSEAEAISGVLNRLTRCLVIMTSSADSIRLLKVERKDETWPTTIGN